MSVILPTWYCKLGEYTSYGTSKVIRSKNENMLFGFSLVFFFRGMFMSDER